MGATWQSIESAPVDENILIAATPDWVGEARRDVEHPHGWPVLVWKWADGSALHANHVPTHWMHKPKHPTTTHEPLRRPAGDYRSLLQQAKDRLYESSHWTVDGDPVSDADAANERVIDLIDASLKEQNQ